MPSQWIVFFICFCFSLSRVLAGDMTMEACEPKECGDFNISYPFWIYGEHPSYCGYPTLEIDCNDGKPFLKNSYNTNYYIKEIFYANNSAVLVNSKLTSNAHYCPILNRNISLSLSQFVIIPSPVNAELFFLYNCSKRLLSPYFSVTACTNQSYLSNETFVRLYTNYPNENQEYPNDLPSECTSSKVPVLGSNNAKVDDYKNLMAEGFWVSWMVADCSRCKESKGQCGLNSSISDFMCICSNRTGSTGITYPVSCPIAGKYIHRKSKFIIVAGAGALASTIACFILIIKFERLRNFLWKYHTQENIETILEKYGSLAPKKYKYAELKKITNSFRDKLGRGGFGTVYRGTEQDGRLIAVKILHNSTSNGEEFINEVISIGRTYHVNVVKLIGFCIEGSKQALVYEYMPNGSLDKYIYCVDPKTSLGWENLYKIAIGIARGLEYLHSGCSTHIVHFDIKPQNILLDEDFCPKIADFGLAKLCPPKESILSMVDMRGTIGFIAPEVFSRSMGVVSTKSDVYSFGMLVLEMVGGRKNAKMGVVNSSQVYFPHWIYDHIIENGEIQVCDVTSETEQIARKMALVGLWCTQMAPASRPSMSKALEMLEKDVDELEMPPKPYFSFSPNSNSENTIQNLTWR